MPIGAPAPSPLDGNQVLQHAFIDTTGELRVNASITPGGGEVIIDHTNDSIRLGDGTSFFTSTSVGGDLGLDVNIINSSLPIIISGIDTPALTNIAIPTANTEQSFSIAATTKKIQMRVRGRGRLRYTFTSGTSGTNFFTVSKGAQERIDNLDLSSGVTVYFQSDTAGETLEVLQWS